MADSISDLKEQIKRERDRAEQGQKNNADVKAAAASLAQWIVLIVKQAVKEAIVEGKTSIAGFPYADNFGYDGRSREGFLSSPLGRYVRKGLFGGYVPVGGGRWDPLENMNADNSEELEAACQIATKLLASYGFASYSIKHYEVTHKKSIKPLSQFIYVEAAWD